MRERLAHSRNPHLPRGPHGTGDRVYRDVFFRDVFFRLGVRFFDALGADIFFFGRAAGRTILNSARSALSSNECWPTISV